MAKDPAFLFYSKDWLQGTSSMMPEEKGVYIDLLSHQHQDGDLPSDTKRLARMVGLSEDCFIPIWTVLQLKFKPKGNRLVNQKLTNIMTERLTKGATNKVSGTFASIIRLGNFSDEIKSELKKSFKIDDFLTESDRSVKERLTDWIMERLGVRFKSIATANGTVNGNINTDIGTVIFDIEKYLKEHRSDFEIVCIATHKTEQEGLLILTKYHLWNQENEKYPKTPLALIAGFRKWLMNENKFSNGTNQQSVGKNGKSTGLQQAIAMLKKDLESGT